AKEWRVAGVLRAPTLRRGADNEVARSTRQPQANLRGAFAGPIPDRGHRSPGAPAVGARRSDPGAPHAGAEASQAHSQARGRFVGYRARPRGVGPAPDSPVEGLRARAVAGNGKRRVRKKRISGAQVRARLADAEATLDAIRTGRVDALVVAGPQGDQTRTIEGATHPYFVLLNAMSDGAALLEPEGTILFGNLGLGDMVGAPVEALLGSSVQLLVAPAERPGFEEFLRAGCEKKSAREFTFVTRTRSAKPVAVSLSPLPLGSYHEETDTVGRDTLVLMAIVMDLTHTKAAEATRARLLERATGAAGSGHRVSHPSGSADERGATRSREKGRRGDEARSIRIGADDSRRRCRLRRDSDFR